MNTLQQIWDKLNNVDVSLAENDIKSIDNVLGKNIINLGLMILIVSVIIIVIVKKVK